MKTFTLVMLMFMLCFKLTPGQPYLTAISIPDAHNFITTGNSDIIVAVFDDGVEISHQDLLGKIWENPSEIPGNGIDDDGNGYIDDVNGWNFFDNNSNVYPYYNDTPDRHGTGVAGILSKVAPGCKILPIKFYNSYNQMLYYDYTQILINAFSYVRNLQQNFPNKRFIINISYGYNGEGDFYDLITDQINECVALEIPVFCSSGNKLRSEVAFPANLPSTISVTGVGTELTNFLYYQEYGTGPENDFAAPDYAYPIASLNNTYDYFHATSASCPMAAGTAALLLSIRPELTA